MGDKIYLCPTYLYLVTRFSTHISNHHRRDSADWCIGFSVFRNSQKSALYHDIRDRPATAPQMSIWKQKKKTAESVI